MFNNYAYRVKNNIFDYCILGITILLVIVCLLPFTHVLSMSLSSERAVLSNEVTVLPIELNFMAYKAIITDNSMLRSLVFTALLTVLATCISMALTISCAYPLTKKRLKGRNIFLILIIITMYFSGGIIPDYILVRNLGLYDSIWALTLPGAISSFLMIILKTFFTSIPPSLEESAYIDGCNDIKILFKIILPLSTPVLACLSLFYAVGRWNGFQDALFYIKDAKLFPLQLKIYHLVYNSMSLHNNPAEAGAIKITAESLKSASVIFATIPILMVYPWLQKYFTSGIMVGAIKA